MDINELKKKLLEDKERKQDAPIDWEFQKTQWIKHIEALYDDIEKWLYDLTFENLIRIMHESIKIREESLGEYSVNTTRIVGNGKSYVELTPIGTVLIGAWGRIDMTSQKGRVALILLPVETKSIKDMIKVEITPVSESNVVKGQIEFGQNDNTGSHSKYPNLEWKILNDESQDIEKLTSENFIATLYKLL